MANQIDKRFGTDLRAKRVAVQPIQLTNQNLGRLVLAALSFIFQRFVLLGNLEALHCQLVLLLLFSVGGRLLAPRAGRTVAIRLVLASHRGADGDVAGGRVLGRLDGGLGGHQAIFDNLLGLEEEEKNDQNKQKKIQQVWGRSL